MLAVTSITVFFVADVQCGLNEINKDNRGNATHGPSPVKRSSETEPQRLDWRGLGPGPVLTLYIANGMCNTTVTICEYGMTQ